MSKADARLELLTVIRKLRSLSQRKYYLKRLLGDRAHKYTFTDEAAVLRGPALRTNGKARQGKARARRGRAHQCEAKARQGEALFSSAKAKRSVVKQCYALLSKGIAGRGYAKAQSRHATQ